MNRLRAWLAKAVPALRKNDGRAGVTCRDCKHLFDAGMGAYCNAWADRQPWRNGRAHGTKYKPSRLCRLINTRGRCRDFEGGTPFVYRDGIGVLSSPDGAEYDVR